MASHQDVEHYYTKVITSRNDFATDVCTLGPADVPSQVKAAIKNIHEDILNKYYGCGLPVPVALKDRAVLDLGCGAGRDVFILSQLVGQEGRVVGLDMAEEQLDFGRQYVDLHMKKFFPDADGKSNIDFRQGFIEKLEDLSMPGTFDLVISNCTVNLAMEKRPVLAGVKLVLKPGGEMYFADMYASERVPEALKSNTAAWGEGLAGALFWKDLIAMCEELGFTRPVLMDVKPIAIKNKALEAEVRKLNETITYASVTYRFFKKAGAAETSTEGQVKVTYKGDLRDCPQEFVLGHGLVFKAGEAVTVAAEVADVIRESRYAPHFDLQATEAQDKALTLPDLDPFEVIKGGQSNGSCGQVSNGICGK